MRAIPVHGWAMLFVTGCGGYSTTTRVVDGETLTSKPVTPQGYALYLEAAIEEASGNLAAARDGYLAATEFDGDDPELWTRVAALSCQLGIRSADEEFDKALNADHWYAPAWVARSQCALRHGDLSQALDFALQAQLSAADDLETTDAVALVYERLGRVDAALRQWVAYTVLHPGDRRGWQRTASFAERHGRFEWAAWASAALGQTEEAWVPPRQSDSPKAADAQLVNAILRDDVDAARSHATNHRLPQTVVIEYALELGRYGMAQEQAEVLVAAYPNSSDLRALALLSAVRANDAERMARWSQLPEALTPLTATGNRALRDLIRECCGVAVGDPAKP